VATFRRLEIPQALHADFMALVNKVVEVSNCLLNVAEQLGQLQKQSFVGQDADEVLMKVQQIAHMEWESDKLNRKFARQYYNATWSDPISVILLDKMCRSLGGIADHAENVAKNLRLMIIRK
jgi:predicted phosphate transport protein (TIGR00153 family)